MIYNADMCPWCLQTAYTSLNPPFMVSPEPR